MLGIPRLADSPRVCRRQEIEAGKLEESGLKVLHLSGADNREGAARAAVRLHTGLLNIGIDSTMLVARKHSNDPSVVQATRTRSFSRRLLRRWRSEELKLSRRSYAAAIKKNWETFSEDRTVFYCDLPEPLSFDSFDVVVLHFIADFVDWTSLFSALARTSAKIVFVLHDMNLFTGGCHYDMGCGRFSGKCGMCPQLSSGRENDVSRQVWTRKMRALSAVNQNRVQIVAPSNWIAQQARVSSLLSAYPITTIALGVETETFKPFGKQAMREVLGIPEESVVISFGAFNIANLRKGTDLLIDAIGKLKSRKNLVVLTIGAGACPVIEGATVIDLGLIKNDRWLAAALGCADVFVIPSRQEVCGQIAIESMACGVPAVGFAEGGMLDYILPGVTGLLARPEDANSLAAAISQLVDNRELRLELGKAARKFIEAENSLDQQALRHAQLYKALCERAATGQ